MGIDYINGSKTDKIYGMSKYQMEIYKRLNIEMNVIEFDSLMHFFENKFSNNLESSVYDDDKSNSFYKKKLLEFILNIGKRTLKTIDKQRYTAIVKNKVKSGNIKHITSQELAYIQDSLKMDKTIITCHDLIPWIYAKDRSRFWKNNISGLKKADAIITVSKFSKIEIVKHLEYPAEHIYIVKDAVDHNLYFENRNKELLSNINVLKEEKVVLYVGSETPRMNLPVLIKAFSKLKKMISGVKLVKIGESQSYGARENILKLIKDLNLQEDIIFVGYVKEEEMPRWYNAADILVYPCIYAGFGLPPLEAMACGTPVITSNTTSLPEVVGDAGIMIDPYDDDFLALNMCSVLTNEDLRDELIEKGIKQAKKFSWDRAAEQTLKVYELFNIIT